MIRRVAVPYAVVGWSAAIVGAVGAVAIRVADPAPLPPSTFGFGDTALVGFAVLGMAFASVGALLVVRRPANLVGWVMVLIGFGYAVGAFWAAVTFSVLAHPAIGWLDPRVTAWLTVLFTTLGGAVFMLGFIFPTGRGPSPAWDRWLKVVAICVPAMAVSVFLIRPGPLHVFPTIENPFGIGLDLRPWFGRDGQEVSERISAMAILFVPVVLWALADRYRRAGSTERQQLKWFGLATAVTVAALAVAGISATLTDKPPEIGLALFGFVGALIPVAIGIAILRRGLYDIDRLISRTLSYGLVTGVLAAVFAASVVGLTALLGRLTDGNSLAVALSTLLVAVLFGPLRRRAQVVIDRRFDRASYDAEQTAQAFAARVRDETDLADVTSDLASTTLAAMAPATLGIWLRKGAG